MSDPNMMTVSSDLGDLAVAARLKGNIWTSKGQRVKTRVYVQNLPAERLGTSRENIAWTKEFAIKPVLKRIRMEDAKVSFSRTAGCSCGCSPGFIVTNTYQPPFDLWIDIPAK